MLKEPEVFRYTIPGCRLAQEGLQGVTMSLALQSLVFNLTHCTAGDVTSCNVTCTDVASGVAEVDCAQDGGVFAFRGCRANCAALPAYNVATNPGGVVGAAEVTCAQGSSILHESVCSPVCKQDAWVNLLVFSDVDFLWFHRSRILLDLLACRVAKIQGLHVRCYIITLQRLCVCSLQF